MTPKDQQETHNNSGKLQYIIATQGKEAKPKKMGLHSPSMQLPYPSPQSR